MVPLDPLLASRWLLAGVKVGAKEGRVTRKTDMERAKTRGMEGLAVLKWGHVH